MKDDFSPDPKLIQWVQELMTGDITDADYARLMDVMDADVEARAYYIDQMQIHGWLSWVYGPGQPFEAGQPGPVLAGSAPPAPAKTSVRLTRYVLAAVAAVTALILCAVAFLPRSPESQPGQVAEPVKISTFHANPNGKPLVRISALSGVRSDGRMALGQWLSAGHLVLQQGSLELTYSSGAKVTVMSPCDYHVENETNGFLASGSIKLKVPAYALPHTVSTATKSFSGDDMVAGIRVDHDGTSEVHVMRGTLEIGTPDVKREETCSAGMAMAWSKDDTVGRVIVHRGDRFAEPRFDAVVKTPDYQHWSCDTVSPLEFHPSRGGKCYTGKMHDWSNLDVSVVPDQRNDSRVRDAIYMLERGSLKVGNRNAAALVYKEGEVTHAEAWLVEGRYGNGVNFSGREKFISTDYRGVEGKNPRSVVFWIRVPEDKEDESIDVAVGWGSLNRGAKWIVRVNENIKDGPLGAVRTECSYGFVIGSTDLRDGKWHHVASVMVGGGDPDVSTHVLHYIDGRLEAVSGAKSQAINTVPSDGKYFPVTLGLSLNSYEHDFGDMDHFFKVRAISGLPIKTANASLDEVYIFEGAISPDVINALMQTNEPTAAAE
ncbi:MAG: hypothetical protein H7A51_16625 [Akkermansiaceae bacterium]|nr:hypothetical protein [Akkermansiaceae bacterium]